MLPLPHTPAICLHLLGCPMQLKPGSTRQSIEQPSPLAMLPSSHCSCASIFPLPQTGTAGIPVRIGSDDEDDCVATLA